MKNAIILTLSILGFTLVETPNPVLINGKPFANALTINGVIAFSVEDFAKALGGTIANLQQAGLSLQGKKLSTLPPEQQRSSAPNAIAARDAASGMPTGKRMHKPFVITKSTDVSTAVFTHQGKSYVPLADVAKAFGGTFTAPANLAPGAPINLNFGANPGAAIGIIPGPH